MVSLPCSLSHRLQATMLTDPVVLHQSPHFIAPHLLRFYSLHWVVVNEQDSSTRGANAADDGAVRESSNMADVSQAAALTVGL
jgi:hypothetical protein